MLALLVAEVTELNENGIYASLELSYYPSFFVVSICVDDVGYCEGKVLAKVNLLPFVQECLRFMQLIDSLWFELLFAK